ncbi:MAG: 3-phosphoshikimate 1-carboxyvinyltransferase [Pseudomonadota bacterium]|nr:3-phosphoshikimate 1-carboxyvinyltransferase [Pseudomonadota bacterium]
MSSSNNLIINKSKPLIGNLKIPGDKSISHRSIILGALSNGELTISNFLTSDDCNATINAMKQLGADISVDDDKVHIKGKGLLSLKKPKQIIDAGNSGTLIRLLTGVLAVQDFDSMITGDESLKKRPMARIIEPLTLCGAKIKADEYKAPLTIYGSPSLKSIQYDQSVASAQVKSCLILSALYISGQSTFYEKVQTRDHTENLLEHFSYKINRDNNSFSLEGKQELIAKDILIGSDISSAAFFIVASLIVDGSCIEMRSVNINKFRTGIITVLKEMGADIEISGVKNVSNEVIGNIKVRHSKLKCVDIRGDIIPSLIDELPILFIACAAASGTSKISGIEELRYKESDRIMAMENGLKAIGINVQSSKDSIEITGGDITGGRVNSYDDHRIAMSFAVAGLISQYSLTIMDTQNISTSFPTFVTILRELGVEVFEV